MPTLADIYSAIDSAKRKGSDLIRNPGASLAQMAGYGMDRANAARDQLYQATEEEGIGYGPKTKALAQQMAQAYNPIGMVFETGKPITFPFIKNMEKAPNLAKSSHDPYAQSIEPHGNYITSAHDVDTSKLPTNYSSGQMEFKNPLVIDWGESGLYTEPDNWKRVLSQQYGGKKGKALSKAIVKDGYDGIVTIKDNSPSEIVDLSRFIAPK